MPDMTSIRVLEAITPSRIGGAEVFVADLCLRLPALGAEITLFCPKGRPFVGYAGARGIKSINWKTHGKIDPLTVIRLAKLIRNRNIDVIHTHLSTASLLGAFAARLARKRSVAHVHGLNSATCFRHSDCVIAVSEAAKQFLCAQGLDEKRVQVVHNGVDLNHFKPIPLDDAKRRMGWDAGQFVFGVFGRLSAEKGQATAIEALFLLRQQGVDARLALVGAGADREDLKRSAQALGIDDSVIFAGFAEDVRELMSACDAVAVPSLKEGFGLAAVEAMALARPVVASNVGGLPEIVALHHSPQFGLDIQSSPKENGAISDRGDSVSGVIRDQARTADETGFLFAPGAPNALAQALSELASDPSRAESLGKQGRKRVEERFNADTQTRKVMKILRGDYD